MTIGTRHLEQLPHAESLRLLASTQIGRVVFSHRALPAVRPVNHLLVGEQIIIRADLGSALSEDVGIAGGMVVAYEADALDEARRTGWSVVVLGRARRVGGAAEAERYRQLVDPWVSGDLAEVVAISADVVTGVRLVAGP